MTAQQQVGLRESAFHRTRVLGGSTTSPTVPPLFVVPDARPEGGRIGRASGPGHTPARSYLSGYLRWLRLSDALVIAVALILTTITRFGVDHAPLASTQFGYWNVSLAVAAAWVLMLHLHSSYDGRFSGHGVTEYRQVFHASLWLFSTVAIVAYALKVDVARGYVMLAFPLGTILLLLSRYAARRWLVRQRRDGKLSDRVLLVGGRDHVEDLVVALHRTPDAGYNVLGACVNDAPSGSTVAGVPVVGAEVDVVARGVDLEVDVIAVSSSAGLGSSGLRRLGWALEGTDIDLVVAPGIMDVAGPRVRTRPVQGLPLIHVEAPRFSGPTLVFKNIMDRTLAAVGLLLLLPLFLTVALSIALTDRGPVFFGQERVGRDGRTFRMLKFRTMITDAESALPALMALNEGSGPLFKMRNDPRVTRVGAFLRRYSLDEFPQLINVLRGEMSLVGPRPPLPREVATYGDDTRRRLLVKPGMTGMWQINGRSNLSWEESVRLDLYYVENWTPLLDLMIIWRTGRVVLRPGQEAGAY